MTFLDASETKFTGQAAFPKSGEIKYLIFAYLKQKALNAISHKEQLNSDFEDLLEAEKIWRNFNHHENSHISAGFLSSNFTSFS